MQLALAEVQSALAEEQLELSGAMALAWRLWLLLARRQSGWCMRRAECWKKSNVCLSCWTNLQVGVSEEQSSGEE